MFAIMHYVQSVQLILDNQTLSNPKLALTWTNFSSGFTPWIYFYFTLDNLNPH